MRSRVLHLAAAAGAVCAACAPAWFRARRAGRSPRPARSSSSIPGCTTSPPPQATTHRSAGWPFSMKPRSSPRKCRLALLAKISAIGLPCALDLVVAVEQPEAQPVRDRAADGAFAGAHEAHEVEVDVRRRSCVASGNALTRALPNTKTPWPSALHPVQTAKIHARAMSPPPTTPSPATTPPDLCPEALAALTAANAGRVPLRRRHMDRPREATGAESFEPSARFSSSSTAPRPTRSRWPQLCRSYQASLPRGLARRHGRMRRAGIFHRRLQGHPARRAHGKLAPAALAPVLTRGHGVHYPKPGALSLTQPPNSARSTRPTKPRALAAVAKATGSPCTWTARASPTPPPRSPPRGITPADLTWRAGRGRALLRRHQERHAHRPRPSCFSTASSPATSSTA
jgi:hypothetical protein